MIVMERDNECERFRENSKLLMPLMTLKDGCTTFRVTYAMLKEFEEDLHVYIHLENNISFPKAIQLEVAGE